MPSHRIVCTTQYPPDQSHDHAHIVEVGVDTDSDGVANIRYTLSEVLSLMDKRDTFYTIGERTGRYITVEEFRCCGRRYIRTKPDDVRDNNLDNLRRCRWASS